MIAQFLSPLRLEDVDGAEGILLEPLRFYSDRLKRIVVAPAGFKTDFASIPRGLWNIFPKRGKHDKAAVLHDAAYRNVLQGHLGNLLTLPKNQCDGLFAETMEVSGVGWFSRTSMVRAVEWFGGPSFERDRAEQRTGDEVV